jgi:hypothetical protein
MATEEFLTSIFQESGISRMILNIEKNIKLPEDYLVDFQKLTNEIKEQNSIYNISIYDFFRTEEAIDEGEFEEEYMFIMEDELIELEHRMDIEYEKLINIMEKYGFLLTEFFNYFEIENIEIDLAKKIKQTYSVIKDNEYYDYDYFFDYFSEITETIDKYINKY